MREDIVYIEHILKAIDKIHAYSEGMSQSDFRDNELAQDAIIRNIEIIGESTKNISKDLKDKYFKIPWKSMARYA